MMEATKFELRPKNQQRRKNINIELSGVRREAILYASGYFFGCREVWLKP
jgi:hypothetical protein